MYKTISLISALLATLTLVACTQKPSDLSAIPTITGIPTDIPKPTLIIKTASPSASQVSSPKLTSPQANTTVTSPLTVTGTVPPGWMFEGQFPIKIIDENNETIAQSTAKEKTPGSWQSGEDVEFTATLSFKTKTKSGLLVLENDNPSGLPENFQSYMIPIKF